MEGRSGAPDAAPERTKNLTRNEKDRERRRVGSARYAQQAICTSLPVLLVAYCVLRGLRMRPRGLAHLQHVDLQFVETRMFVEVGGETAVPGQQFVARNASSGLVAIS